MLLLDEITREINSLFEKFENLIAVLICDSEGASVVRQISRFYADSFKGQQTFMLQKLISCSENVCKLELGECKRIVCQYDDYQLASFFRDRLVATAIGNNQIEIGTLMSLENEFGIICDSIQAEIKNI